MRKIFELVEKQPNFSAMKIRDTFIEFFNSFEEIPFENYLEKSNHNSDYQYDLYKFDYYYVGILCYDGDRKLNIYIANKDGDIILNFSSDYLDTYVNINDIPERGFICLAQDIANIIFYSDFSCISNRDLTIQYFYDIDILDDELFDYHSRGIDELY